MSGGRFRIEVFPGGQIMPPLECFDAASQGHRSRRSWPRRTTGPTKEPAIEWFTTIPFGMNPEGMAAWYYQGDGLKLWEEAYAAFNLVPRPARRSPRRWPDGSGRRSTRSATTRGSRCASASLGGKVFARAGGTAVLTPGAEIYAALERGVIDAAEWVGPHDDMKLGLHKTARYYYYPGWHEPGTTNDFGFNKKAYDALPVDLRRMLDHAAAAVQIYGRAEYHAKNAIALQRLKTEFKGKVEIAPASRRRCCAISRSWRPRSSGRNRRRRRWPGRSTRRSRSSRRWSAPGTTSPKAPTISSWPDDRVHWRGLVDPVKEVTPWNGADSS